MAQPSENAIRVLANNHARFLSFLEPRVGSREAAEDVLQAAFVKGIEKSDTIREDESAVAWFYRLLRNAITDRHRRRGAQKRREAKHERATALGGEREDRELERAVCKCMDELIPTLKPEYSKILARADLEGAPLPQVASELGITPNNAAVRLHRARKALKKQLEITCGSCTEHGCLDCTCRKGANDHGCGS